MSAVLQVDFRKSSSFGIFAWDSLVDELKAGATTDAAISLLEGPETGFGAAEMAGDPVETFVDFVEG